MNPSLSVPTDNIYKFACLFGLALVISGIFAFVATYTASLDRKIRFYEVIIPLETKQQRTKAEDEVLALHKKLVEITKSNENTGFAALAAVLVIGLCLSWYGAKRWHQLIQLRDDRLASLQVQKLEAEIEKLRAECAAMAYREPVVPGQTDC